MKTVTNNKRVYPVFTSIIPDVLELDKVYISIDYKTVVHLCACGCGEEVVTPLQPSEWKITYDGETVSLHPSIGNWSYKCRSHYWIKKNQIVWAEDWSDERVKRTRQLDTQRKNLDSNGNGQQKSTTKATKGDTQTSKPITVWDRFKRFFK
ncbi:DUF6527 family protein [Paenibacillus beijingensis]|uniref:Uncharacterized protein n=1 Tax=Paenibacillus beijingensis TaxID=1126833 RepID=A0A0D5NMR5_9BACL|nr:DUF6527 family protein [Paenibacillus beijingensis]AJY76282.1 hypothetical protein VN24_19100 [Paenibacillus beijingensis]